MGGVEYQVTKVDPTDPHTKGAVYQVHKVTEEIAATLGGKVYRARIINDPTAPTVAGKVYQIVLIGDPEDPAIKGKVYNAILTGGSEAVVIGPAVSPLVLPDAVAGELKYVKAYGGTEQNGTPTPDAPVDIVSNNGVLKYTPNLLDMSAENIVLGAYINNSGVVVDSSVNFYNSKYIPVAAGETYTWSTSSSIGYFSVMEYDSGYVFKKRTLFSNAGTSGSITLRSDTAFVLIGSNMNGTSVTLDKITEVDWQFEKGSSATAYKPYSPTGIYADGTVETINANRDFFSRDGETVGQIINSDGTVSANSNYVITAPCQLPAGDYTCTWNTGSGSRPFGIFECDTDGNIIPTESGGQIFYDSVAESGINTGAFTISTPKLVRVSFRRTATDLSVRLLLGTATAEMLLKIGDYADVQEILSGNITRNVGVKVFDGTEDWTTTGTNGSNNYRFSLSIDSNDNAGSSLCTHIDRIVRSSSTAQSDRPCIRFTTSGLSLGWYDTDNTTTLAQFKQFLADQYAAGTPVILVYPLAEPTTEVVAGQSLQVTQGDNTLEITQASIDGLELEAEYEKEAE